MKIFSLLLFLIFSNIAQSQVHWLINKDSITDCSSIKAGKFVNEEMDGKITAGYSIEIRGNEVIERLNDGEYYLKSKINFTSECSYELTVLETTIPGNENLIGTKIITEILESAKVDNLIKIRSKGNEWQEFVLRKIED